MSMLEVANLSKTYPAFQLRDVSFSVESGAIMGLIGRNGAGKSTTLKSLLHLIEPDGGAVRMFGMDYYANELRCKQQLGLVLGAADFYVNQKVRTMTDVTRRFYDAWDEDRYRRLLELFAIDESKRLRELSEGMKVKYMLALALSHDAKLLILDEPTSGLDPVSRDELTQLFRRVVDKGDRSILFSTHITSDLEKCATHITLLHEGTVRCSDTRDGFLAHYRDRGATLEEIFVSLERRDYGDLF